MPGVLYAAVAGVGCRRERWGSAAAAVDAVVEACPQKIQMRVGGLLVAARFDEYLVLVDEWLKSRLQNICARPTFGSTF